MGRGQGNSERLEKWLQRNRFPYVGKLSMDNFYSVMKVSPDFSFLRSSADILFRILQVPSL